MKAKERRNNIKNLLINSSNTIKGQELAEKLGVTRQVIVKDIALLRAEGKKIIATPEGYLVTKNQENLITKIIAVSHNVEDIQDELETVIKFGGIVKDVVVEHSVYGEIKAMIMIKSLYDVHNFMKKINKGKGEPLLVLTGGIHLHTICADNDEIMDNILSELKNKKYLIY